MTLLDGPRSCPAYNLCLITPPLPLPEKPLTKSPTDSCPRNLSTYVWPLPYPTPTSPVLELPTQYHLPLQIIRSTTTGAINRCLGRLGIGWWSSSIRATQFLPLSEWRRRWLSSKSALFGSSRVSVALPTSCIYQMTRESTLFSL